MSKQITLIAMDALGAAIKAHSKAHGKLDAQWHVLACSAIDAFAQHGNVFYINQVYTSLGKGARHIAMTEFFTQFGGVSANTGENKKTMPFAKDANKKADLVKAMEHPWYTLKPSVAPDEVVDYLKLAMKLVSKAPTDKQTAVNGELRMRVAEVVRAYAAENNIEGLELPTVSTDGEGEGEPTDALSGVSAE
jgi:hypothetical protein